MVDFQKGEKYVHGVVKSVFADIYPAHRQMNMDYSITQAAKYRTGSSLHWLNILLIYDIVCQWVKYFLQRVQLCNTLEVLEHQEWLCWNRLFQTVTSHFTVMSHLVSIANLLHVIGLFASY
jgi:hypothetical protein